VAGKYKGCLGYRKDAFEIIVFGSASNDNIALHRFVTKQRYVPTLTV
jgi:hypothetical protein